MPKARDVHARRFDLKRVLFEDRHFSIAWGHFKGRDRKDCVGVRWRGKGSARGFPRAAWLVVPKWLAMMFLAKTAKKKSAKVAEIKITLKDLRGIREY